MLSEIIERRKDKDMSVQVKSFSTLGEKIEVLRLNIMNIRREKEKEEKLKENNKFLLNFEISQNLN